LLLGLRRLLCCVSDLCIEVQGVAYHKSLSRAVLFMISTYYTKSTRTTHEDRSFHLVVGLLDTLTFFFLYACLNQINRVHLRWSAQLQLRDL
jgi:hypothetical protein